MLPEFEKLIGHKIKDIKSLYKKVPKEKEYPHLEVVSPNTLHQIDVLYLPEHEGFKYLLLMVDYNNGHIEGRALKNLSFSDSIIHAIDDIYEKSEKFNYPTCIEGDNEFDNKYFKKWCKDGDINLKITEEYRHRQLNKINQVCKTIGAIIWKVQISKEMETKKTEKEWRSIYRQIIDILNKNTAKKPKKKEPLPNGKIDIVMNNNKNILDIGVKCRISLTHPRDHKWSTEIYEVSDFKLIDDQPVLYKVKRVDNNKIIKTHLTREQLQPI